MDTENTQNEGEKMPEIKMEDEAVHKSEKNTLMGILSYIGPLVIIPYLTAKDDSFVFFHIKQGLVLFVGEVALWVLMSMLWFLFPIWQLINLVIFVLAVIGIVNVVQGKEKMLPLVGKYADKFKI